MDSRLFEILACPLCKGSLKHLSQTNELICFKDRLAFSIVDDIPVMIPEKARTLTLDEVESLR